MFEGDRLNQNNRSTHHVRFRFLEENWKYQMPVRTKDLDKAIAEVIGTFEGVEEIIALLREGIVNYIERKDILAVLPTLLDGKSLLFQLPVCKKGVGRQHTTVTSYQNAACSNEFFLYQVDYN